MKIPLSLIQEHVDINLPPAQIAHTLTLAGLEVENIEHETPPFSGVVAAMVKEVKPHPEAENLKIVLVDDGKELCEVVCGAVNCRKGLKVAFAKIGAKIKDSEGKVHHIQKALIRGVNSYGMLCSEKELSLSHHGDGIMEVPEDVEVGAELASIFHDPIFEVSFTPNLGHCMSAVGIARELAAILQKELKMQQAKLQESTSRIDKKITVTVEDKKNCPRYSCRVIEDIQVGPSPFWLRNLLENSGIRSINNVVDATNLIMLEYGHPLHAFDYDQIENHQIKVLSTKERLKFTTVNNVEQHLPAHSLVIADSKKVLALAGIIGGKDSAISEKSTNILIEAAFFDPITIRKSSRSLLLRTESALRFEKGVNPNTIYALEEATSLIQQLCGGKIVKGAIDIKEGEFLDQKIAVRLARINSILGTNLKKDEINDIFVRLGFSCNDKKEAFEVSIPPYRHDITQEIDLIEEVARIYGYNNIEKRAPYFASSTISDDPIYTFKQEIRAALLGEGLQEVQNCDLIGEKLAKVSYEESLPEQALIKVLHSKSEEQAFLRPSLMPGLLQMVKLNLDHKNQDLNAFEIGSVYLKKNSDYREELSLAILLSGKNHPYHFEQKGAAVDFLDLKGLLENFFQKLKTAKVLFLPANHPSLHPGKQAGLKIGDFPIGVIGEVHPDILVAFDIKQKVFYSEIDLNLLLKVKKEAVKYAPLPQFPSSERDWTVMVKEELPFATIVENAKNFHSPILENVSLLDIYRDEAHKGQKSVTLRFIYRHPTKTLSFEEVEKEHLRIIDTIQSKL